MTNQVSLSSLKIANGLGDTSPIPVYDGTTGKLVKSVDLETLRYLFKDKTIDPYRTGVKLTSNFDIVPLRLDYGAVINYFGTQDEEEITSDDIVEIHMDIISNPNFEFYISHINRLVLIGGVFNSIDVVTCKDLYDIEILDYRNVTVGQPDNFGHYIPGEFEYTAIVNLDILDLRYNNNINHLYLIGSSSYINKLYYRYKDKFLIFLNFRNSIIYTEKYINSFINNVPTFTASNPCILYNIDPTEPTSSDILSIAQEKNVIIKDVIF